MGTVRIILDRDFGDRLIELDPSVPVWIVDSACNGDAVRRLRREDDVKGLRRDVTTFKYSESESNEELLISRLATIDLHHGPDSSSLPFTTLDVIGLPLTHRIRAELG